MLGVPSFCCPADSWKSIRPGTVLPQKLVFRVVVDKSCGCLRQGAKSDLGTDSRRTTGVRQLTFIFFLPLLLLAAGT